MASIGKKILSAFVEISHEKTPPVKPVEHGTDYPDAGKSPAPAVEHSEKFLQHFEKLFREANIPGPDYFEFSKMIEAMNSIPDEKARYTAAFAGLGVQGLDKTKLLSTAAEYLRVLNTDASNFDSTVDLALKEKVHTKKKEFDEKAGRIEHLSREIHELRPLTNVDASMLPTYHVMDKNLPGCMITHATPINGQRPTVID